jgi:S1-C subfamily serine protease
MPSGARPCTAGAGLRDGDIVASLAGKVANRGELIRLLTEGKIGEKVRIEFLRQGQRQAADLALGVWTPAPPRKAGETDF